MHWKTICTWGRMRRRSNWLWTGGRRRSNQHWLSKGHNTRKMLSIDWHWCTGSSDRDSNWCRDTGHTSSGEVCIVHKLTGGWNWDSRRSNERHWSRFLKEWTVLILCSKPLVIVCFLHNLLRIWCWACRNNRARLAPRSSQVELDFLSTRRTSTGGVSGPTLVDTQGVTAFSTGMQDAMLPSNNACFSAYTKGLFTNRY